MSAPTRIVIMVVAAIALTGGGFVAGMNARGAGESRADAAASASPSGTARRTTGGGAGGQQMTSGRVLSVGDGSITVEVRDPSTGQSRSIIALVGGARVVRSTETDIKASDIKVGDEVLVAGQPETSTGAVAANAVVVGVGSLQQLFGGGQNGGGRSAAPSATGSGAPRRSPAASPTP